MGECPCPDCKGRRLKKESLAVTVGGLDIDALTRLSVVEELEWVEALALTDQQHLIADRILKEIRSRLGFLRSVGLGYLTLSRSAGTLSGGESQRIRLATQIGSSLMGVLYILDEPSIGLHQRDNDKLLGTLRSLRDMGNTLLVVEHDEDTMRAADYLIDIGPGAGIHGGEVVSAGTPGGGDRKSNSLTGQYLSGREKSPSPAGAGAAAARCYGWWARRRTTCAMWMGLPPGDVHGGDGGVRQRQILPGERGAVQAPGGGADADEGPSREVPAHRGIGVPGQGGGYRPKPHRPDAQVQSRHLHGACSTTSGSCSPPPRRPRAGAMGRGGSGFNVRGGRCEACSRRRCAEDRDALPAGYLRPLRGVQGPPLQPGDAGGPL